MIDDVIWIIVVVVGGIGFLIWRANSKARTAQLWADRAKQVKAKTNRYAKDLESAQIVTELKIATKGYYHTAYPIELFNMNIDYEHKKVAFCSFEETPYKFYVLDFANVKSFAILDGISNTTSTSYTSGVGTSYRGIGSGIASTDTYSETTMENIRLKIETNDEYSLGIQVCLFFFEVDVSSGAYRELLKAIEDIKSILAKIVENNRVEGK